MAASDGSEAAVEQRPGVALLAGAVAFFAITGIVWAFFLGQMLILKGVIVFAVALAAALILMEPLAGLCLFVFLVPTENLMAFGRWFTAAKLVGMVTFISFLVYVVRGRGRLSFDRQIVWILAFACWSGLSFLWSDSMTSAFFFFTTVLQIGFFWVLMRSLVRTRGEVLAVTVSFLGGTLLAVAASVAFPRGTIGPRMVYAHGNPNHLARDIVISLILLLYFIPNWRPVGRVAGTAAGMVLVLSLALTQSRACWAGAAICLPLLFFGRGGARSGWTFGTMVCGAIVLLGMGVLAARLGITPQLLEARGKSMFVPRVIRVSRLEIWRAGLTMGLRSPLLGVGAGNFIRHMPGIVERMRYFSHTRTSLAGHNSFIESFAELGILGFVFLAAVVVACFQAIKHHPPSREKALGWALLLFAVIRMTFATSHYQKSIWFALVLSQIVTAIEILRPGWDEAIANEDN